MFQFPGFASRFAPEFLVFDQEGFPIRTSADQFLFADPRSFSQLITSFFASESLGIPYRDWETDRKSTRLNSSHSAKSRMPSSA